MQTARSRRWPRRPQQPQPRLELALLAKAVALLQRGQQIGLLLLHQHRPTQLFLQTPAAAMALAMGEHDPTGGLLLQPAQVLITEQRHIHQHRATTAGVQQPGRAAVAVATGGKCPQTRTQRCNTHPIHFTPSSE